MAGPGRLVLFVEGPILVKQLITDLNGWDVLFLDNDPPFMAGNVADLTRNNGEDWLRLLGAARKKSKLSAVLLVQDGDLGRIRGEDFCAGAFAPRLADWAKMAGAGKLFSAACVFACQEYESWLLPCAERLAGQPLPDQRTGINAGTTVPAGDIEQAPRDAKGWLDSRMQDGYKPTRDQALLTAMMVQHLDVVRQHGLRSFRRLENALRQLIESLRAGIHISSPGTAT